MTFVVPFDGSELAQAALVRATEFGVVFEEDVLAVSVIPRNNAAYARAHDWIGRDEAFDLETVVATLHRQVAERCPGADFRHKVVGRHAPAGAVADRVRRVATDEDASMVFVGSADAGHMVVGISRVGRSIAADSSYDVVIVRDRSPAKIAKLERAAAERPGKSDFYLPE